MERLTKGKKTNHRKHPGIRGRRPDNKADRIKVAMENKERWERFTPKEQLAELDKRLGRDVGAQKQRVRLAALIASAKTAAQ